MKNKLREWLICGLALVCPALVLAADNTYTIRVTRIIDGDTVVFAAPWLPQPLKPELSLRIHGIDTPESGVRAKCESERNRAAAAKRFADELISNAKQTQIVLIDHDKYGGRVLGDLLLDGSSFRSAMLQQNYARQYDGGTKHDWCSD